jgi:electron transport complex protein RnfC
MENVRLYGGLTLRTELPPPHVSIEEVPPPKRIILPLSDQSGISCRALVEKDETVFKGEKIAEDPEHRLMPIHAPISGKVMDINDFRFTEFGIVKCLFIESDGREKWKTDPVPHDDDYLEHTPQELCNIIREAGVKIIPFDLLPRFERSCDVIAPVKRFVINGIGHGFAGSIVRRLLVEQSEDLLEGVTLIKRLFQPEKVYLAVNGQHDDAIRAAVEKGLEKAVEMVRLDVYYPLGYPHLLYKELFREEIPSPAGKAIDKGVAFASVDTMLHALEAIKEGRALMERYVTVSGEGIQQPKHLRARIGTPLKDLIEYCGGFKGNPGRVVVGNPLDGSAQFSLQRPVLKDTRWIWVQPEEKTDINKYRACINCGDCVDICPVRLMPNVLGNHCEFCRFEEAAGRHDLFTCIECGLCAYVCPSKRPLVHFIKYGKWELSLKG